VILQCEIFYNKVIGFIDGTARRIGRPTRNQEAFFNGYYAMQYVKFRSMIFQNGIIYLTFPLVGCHNDLYMLKETKVGEVLSDSGKLSRNRREYYLYCESGHADSEFIRTGYQEKEVV